MNQRVRHFFGLINVGKYSDGDLEITSIFAGEPQ